MHAARHLIGVLASSMCFAAPAAAQQFEILHAFQAPLANAKAPLLAASDGALCNVVHGLAAKGALGDLRRAAVRGSPADLDDRARVRTIGRRRVVDALVEGHDGWLDGAAPEHGANGRGTIFKVSRDGPVHSRPCPPPGPMARSLAVRSSWRTMGLLRDGR